MVISSKDNKIVKEIKSLSLKKFRDELGLFVAEGARNVSDIISFSPDLVKYVAVNSSYAGSVKADYVIEDNIFSRISETENSQGILCVCVKPKEKEISSDYILYLDGIKDPGNLGTILRTAVGAGYGDIILSNCTDELSGKVVRSAMSAIVKLNILHSFQDIIAKLKEKGYNIFGADMNGNSVFNTDKKDKICLVIGSEATGMSSEVKAQLDEVVSVPMVGDIESLNAAVSAGILMYNLKF